MFLFFIPRPRQRKKQKEKKLFSYLTNYSLTGRDVLEHPLRDADGVLGGASRDVLDVGLVGELLEEYRERERERERDDFFLDGVEATKEKRREEDARRARSMADRRSTAGDEKSPLPSILPSFSSKMSFLSP